MAVDLNKLNFYSNVNYMKRSDRSGSRKISGSSVSVSHGLGYIPQYVYYVDLDNNGILWYGGEKVDELTGSPRGTASNTPRVDSWISTNVLTLAPYNISSNRDVFYIFYVDYGGY